MSIQRVLTRLSPLLVMCDPHHIPSFRSTMTSNPAKVTERSWREALKAVDLGPLSSRIFEDKRVVFFGEQHQQSQVLKAQMLVLRDLHQSCIERSKRLVVVFEHFNLTQDDLLSRFSKGSISDEDFVAEYSLSREGFPMVHYLPLLTLARELGVPMYGGFPPREWASMVYKESIAALKAAHGKEIDSSFSEEGRWRQVSEISVEQVAYLQSMMSGSAPQWVNEGRVESHDRGILPAQTLKDTFLAWSIDRLLKEDKGTVVLAVCGLGHCEYGICASARLQSCRPDEVLILASKDLDSCEWQGDESEYTSKDKLAHVIIPYEADS